MAHHIPARRRARLRSGRRVRRIPCPCRHYNKPEHVVRTLSFSLRRTGDRSQPVTHRAMSRDERDYPDPESFLPERFLPAEDKPAARDPAEYIFGFGRRSVSSPNMSKRHAWKPNHALLRICPGRYFAEASLLIYTASILHVFNIRPPLDEHGVPLKLKYRATDEMVSYVSRLPPPHINVAEMPRMQACSRV